MVNRRGQLTNWRVSICGVPVDRLEMSGVLDRIGSAVRARRSMAIAVVNVAKLVTMRRDPRLRHSVESSDLILADGMPLVWLSRLLGEPLPERVAGIDLMFEILRLAARERRRVFFLGARPVVVRRVVELAEREFAGLVVAGYRDGYFPEAEEESVARHVKESGADILLVAMSSPKKELFMERWSRFMRVPVCHGVGGSFDVMAGVIRRAPLWMQRVGLEWAFRLLQEPRRMWKRYLVTNTVFLVLAFRDVLSRGRSRGRVVGGA